MMPMKFTVTDEHVALLQRFNVRWDDDAYYGAPTVDIKRPYGNSDVLGDVAEILGWHLPLDRYDEPTMSQEQGQRATALHEEMHVVLQILVQNPTTFSTGTWANTDRSAPYGVTYTKES